MFNMGCDSQSLVSWHHGMGFNGSIYMFEQSDGLTDKRILRQKKKKGENGKEEKKKSNAEIGIEFARERKGKRKDERRKKSDKVD